MKTYKEFVAEALNEPYPWKWKHKKVLFWEANFKDDNEEYTVEYETLVPSKQGDKWEVVFYTGNGNWALTGNAEPFKVFATVLQTIRSFIKEKNPDLLRFSAAAEDEVSGKKTNRARLYTRMIKKFLPSSYKLSVIDYQYERKFTIVRREGINEASFKV